MPILLTRKNDLKTIWRNINTICSFSQTKRSNSNQMLKLSVNNNVISSNEISNTLKDYFCNVVVSITSQLQPPIVHYNEFLKNSVKSSFFCDIIQPNEVIN